MSFTRPVVAPGRDDIRDQSQRHCCQDCWARFDDLTGTVLAGHYQPLWVWIIYLYLGCLNLINRQIAQDPDFHETDAQATTEQLRHGLGALLPPVRLEGLVKIGEVHVVAFQKGNPAVVAKQTRRLPAAVNGRT